jgi:hypothetical protein
MSVLKLRICNVGIILYKKSKVFAIGGGTFSIFAPLRIDYQQII